MPSMALFAWIALAFFAAVLVPSGAFAAVRGLRAWRAFRAFSGRTTTALADLSQAALRAEAQVAGIGAGSLPLQAATARLRRSLSELDALRAAAGETGLAARRIRRTIPRK
jgi:hypothetical protein